MATKELKENVYDKDEPLLQEENRRFTMFPIKYPKIWDAYKEHLNAFWKADEVTFSKDYDDYLTLNENEQHFLKMILAFFAASDGIVNFNLNERFARDVKIMEAQTFYAFQMAMENIHNEIYSLMLENLVKDPVERDNLFNAIETVPAVKRMADWAFKWIDSPLSFAHRLIAFAIVEGVFFSGMFASIYWFKKYKNKGKMFLDGLCTSNEFIARDEGMHCNFACLLYEYIVHRVPKDEVYKIMDEAVNIVNSFMNDALQIKLIGMNSEYMNQYNKYIGDRLLVALNYPKLYNAKNPFKFMETIGLPGKKNFFEGRETAYQSAHTNNSSNKGKITILDDF